MGTQGRRTDEQTRRQALRLAEMGASKSEIARQLWLNRETVAKILKEAQDAEGRKRG